MAISWWICTGIYQKMESDVYLLKGGSNYSKALWEPEYVRSNLEPLAMDHILLPLIIFGMSLFLSIVTFFFEQLHFLYTTKAASNMSETNLRKINVMATDSKSRFGTMYLREHGKQVKFEVGNKENLNERVIDGDEILVDDSM